MELNQEEYEKRYVVLTECYNTTKEKYDKVTERIEAKKAQRELIKGFIRTLESMGVLPRSSMPGCGVGW